MTKWSIHNENRWCNTCTRAHVFTFRKCSKLSQVWNNVFCATMLKCFYRQESVKDALLLKHHLQLVHGGVWKAPKFYGVQNCVRIYPNTFNWRRHVEIFYMKCTELFNHGTSESQDIRLSGKFVQLYPNCVHETFSLYHLVEHAFLLWFTSFGLIPWFPSYEKISVHSYVSPCFRKCQKLTIEQ